MKITRYTVVELDGLSLIELASKVDELRAIYGNDAYLSVEDEWGNDRLCIVYEDDPTATELADIARKAEEAVTRLRNEKIQLAEAARMARLMELGDKARAEKAETIAEILARYEEGRMKAGERA